MKNLLEYLVDGFHITPTNGIISLVLWTLVNAGIRFGTLYGVIYVSIKAFQAAVAS